MSGALPPGFTLDPAPGLPPGFTLDPPPPATGQGEHGYAPAPPEPPPAPDPFAPVEPSYPDYVQRPLPTSVAEVRQAMRPAPGYVPTGILPFSLRETVPGSGEADPTSGVGGMHWDWGPVRTVVNPLLDLLEGTGQATSVGGPNAPLAGKVSPEGTALLASGMMGNPFTQFRNPLIAPGRDIRFGPPEARPPSAGDLKRAPLPEEFTASPLTPEARTAATSAVEAPSSPTTPTGIPVTQPPPVPPPPIPEPATATEPPGPRSVGAAASGDITPAAELGLTPGEEAAYRSTAEGNKLLEPQEPGVRDDKQYLTGERINEAQASQDVEVARELKSLREQTPALDKSMTADETHNNNIRANAINNAIPGQVQINAARTARQDAMAAAEPRVFANATDADVRPIVAGIQDILNDPKNRQNSQLQQYVRPLIDRLVNEDGTPKITDPRELWGWRQDVQHLTSGAAQRGDPNLARVSGMLGKVLDVTDDRIEAAAPGYKASLRDDYRNRSREIDAMEALNAERFKLFDSQNKPNYNAVQSLMRRVIDARQANDPYDPFTHVTQDTLDKFWNIRDSMRRQAAVDRLGAPRGSPTSQNLGDALRGAGKMALKGAAPVIGGTIGSALIPIPGVGPALGIAAGATVNHLLSERAMGQRLVRGLELTNPNRMLMPPP